MDSADTGAFWLRRIEMDHFAWPEFTDRFENGRSTLMNFSVNFPLQAATIPNGARMLVWVRQTRRIWSAIEITGTLEDGIAACRAHGFEPDGSRQGQIWGRLYRPARFLARFERHSQGTTLSDASAVSGVRIDLKRHSMQQLGEGDWTRLFDSIPWDSRS